MFDQSSRDSIRRAYIEAWRKRRERLPLEPLETQIADVIELHPEYQAALTDGDATTREFTPDGGQSNPFLHMGLHLAIREQVATDRPPGIRHVFATLERRAGSTHEAEHRAIDCLAEALWNAQRNGRPPDEIAYLDALKKK
jgi:hypothetical protein